jgi:nitrogen fixation/metabolism regulation signal transduction histidine kinase
MFKTIENRLRIFTLLLIGATAGTVWLLVEGRLGWGLMALCAALWLMGELWRHYKKFNKSVIFLLNALENGDYSFSFSESKIGLSGERRDVNIVLNAIKDILIKARQEEIENEKFLSLIVADSPVGMAIIDERDFVKVANDAALRLLGLNVFTHVRQLAMVDESVLDAFRELTPGKKATICVSDEREERQISMGVSKIRIKNGFLRVVTMHNIAGELEEREMESWIKLIRVMTHEIMNSIAPITSLSETMLDSYSDSSQQPEKLRRNTVEAFETITSTARGLLSFVESYRRFTGIPKPQLQSVETESFVDKIVTLVSPTLSERGIAIATRFSEPGITVSADEGQIGQVLTNLLKNAIEAIPATQTDGRIEVIVSKNEADGSDAQSRIQIDVVNNGTPIAAEVLPHIFVPFFTTKSSGTGIGLSVSRYIMRLHGGNLKHHSEGGLTSFCMIF